MKFTSMFLGALVAAVLMTAPASAQDEPAAGAKAAPAAAPAAKAAPAAVVYVPVGCCSYSKSLDHFWEGRHPADYACWHGCHGHSHAHYSCYSSCYSHCGGHGHGCCSGGGSLFYFHLF